MGLNLKDIDYENGKLMFTFSREVDGKDCFFSMNIPKGSSAPEVRKKIYLLLTNIMIKEGST